MALSLLTARRAGLIVAALSVICVAACGRRGDLEPPSASAVQKPDDKHGLQVHRASQKITPPQKDFVLDPLLK